MKSNSTTLSSVPARNYRLKGILMLLLLLATLAVQAQTIYFWRGASGANFTGAPDNWCTSLTDPVTMANRRNSQLSTDVLVFSGGAPVVTVDANQTIGQLSFIDGTFATLNSPLSVSRTITINGDATSASDLIVGNGSSVSLVGTLAMGNNSAGVVLALNTSATGSVAGTVKLTSAGGNGPSNAVNKMQSTTVGSLHFISPGAFIIADRMTSTAFTNAPVFETGSTLEQSAANSSDHSALATYQPGSTFRYIDGTFGGTALVTDRTFGNLEYASTIAQTIGGAINLTIANNLTLTGSGSLTLNARGNASGPTGTLIGGNVINTNAAATLAFNPSAAAPNTPKVVFNGTTPQTISSTGSLTFGTNAKLEINNAQGVTLQKDLTIANDLLLTSGLLTTGASGSGLLTMSSPTAAATGSSTSFVNGPLARQNATGTSTLLFPIGKVAVNGDLNYRPITLALTSQTNSVTYTAQQTEGSVAVSSIGAPIDHVSHRRYYSVAASATPTGGSFAARITLSFGTDDYVTNATTSSLVVGSRNGGAWSSIGSTNTGAGTTSTAPLTGTLTSGTFAAGAFTSLSDFTLASTAANIVGYPGLNPLPVELIRFDAAAKGSSVGLTWATASEKNSAYFEVQRSATGVAYETIGRVAAQGNSSSLHTYEFLDARPLAGLAYYRLRQVDNDGITAFSPVATARRNTELAIYPNPTTDAVMLPASLGPVRYRILNGLGQALSSGQAGGGDRLDLSTLPKGAFFLELTDSAGRHTQRLTRQ